MPNKLHGTRSPGKTANPLYRSLRKYAVLLPRKTWVGKLYYNLPPPTDRGRSEKLLLF